MKLPEWDQLPKNKYIILLKKCGNDGLQIDSWKDRQYPPSKNITNMTVTVYNENTDRVSDKSVYKEKKDNKLFIKCRPCGYGKIERLFLDDFIQKASTDTFTQDICSKVLEDRDLQEKFLNSSAQKPDMSCPVYGIDFKLLSKRKKEARGMIKSIKEKTDTFDKLQIISSLSESTAKEMLKILFIEEETMECMNTMKNKGE